MYSFTVSFDFLVICDLFNNTLHVLYLLQVFICDFSNVQKYSKIFIFSHLVYYCSLCKLEPYVTLAYLFKTFFSGSLCTHKPFGRPPKSTQKFTDPFCRIKKGYNKTFFIGNYLFFASSYNSAILSKIMDYNLIIRDKLNIQKIFKDFKGTQVRCADNP